MEPTPSLDRTESEIIQICTDIYYECETIKHLDELTDKATELITSESNRVLNEFVEGLKQYEITAWVGDMPDGNQHQENVVQAKVIAQWRAKQ